MVVLLSLMTSLSGCDVITGQDSTALIRVSQPYQYSSEKEVLRVSGPSLNYAPASTVDEYNQIIPLILTYHRQQGEYCVVNPELGFSFGRYTTLPTGRSYTLEEMYDGFLKQGVDVRGQLLNVLTNYSPIRVMNISSSPEEGYLIDYNHQFLSIFDKYTLSDGWKKFHQLNPFAGTYVTISWPVYSPETKVVLVYYYWANDWTTTGADIIAFEFDGSSLKELARLNLW